MKKSILLFIFLSLLTGCVKLGPNILEIAGVTNGEAALELGNINYYADEPDYTTAAEWYYKSAIQNNGEGSYRLAQAWESGTGVEQNDNEAAYWYKRAAEKGHSDAQYKIALMYHTGTGIEADATESAKWMLKAANKGNGDAQKHMGDYFSEGAGVKQNTKKAVSWYTKSAEHGNREAQMILGDAFTSGGLGLKQDRVKGCGWYIVASLEGDCTGLSSEEIAKARNRTDSLARTIARKQK